MNVRRSVGGFLAATVLATTITLIPAPAAASDLSGFCAHLADTIAALEAKPESWLQQFLLAHTRRVFNNYCS